MSLYRDTQEQRAGGWQDCLPCKSPYQGIASFPELSFNCLCASSLNFISQNWSIWLPKLQRRLAKWVFDIWNLYDRRCALPVGKKSEGIYSGWKARLSAMSYMAKQASKFVVSISLHKDSVNLLVTMHPHQHLEIVKTFCPSFAALIFVPLITNATDHFLMCLCHSGFSCEMPIFIFCLFFILNFFSYWLYKDSKFLLVMWLANNFSLSVVWPDFIYQVPCLTEDFNILILSFMVMPFCIFKKMFIFGGSHTAGHVGS